MTEIVTAINNLAEPRFIDWATLLVAGASFVISILAACISYKQKAISERDEKGRVLEDLFDILHILKKYDGSNLERDDLDNTFKALQKMQIKYADLLSKNSLEFISEVLENMQKIGRLKNYKDKGIAKEVLDVLKSAGLEYDDSVFKEENIKSYNKCRYFFTKGAFVKYQKLFVE